jgi:phosphohistidine swiveling domain-containing protein
MSDKVWVVDDEPSRRYPIYTRGNVGEVFPDVVSPLTWSLFGPYAEAAWRAAYREFGAFTAEDFGDESQTIVIVNGGYAYLNMSLIRILAVRTPGLSVAAMDAVFFGESEAPAYTARPADKNLRASARVAATLLRTLRAKSLPRLEADKEKAAAWLQSIPDLATSPDDALIAAVNRFHPVFADLFQSHLLTTTQATVGPGLLTQICTGKLGDPTLPNTLLAGIGSIESAAPASALWDLGRMVASDPALTALFDAGLDGLERRADDDPAADRFRRELAAFQVEFGSRGPNEWDSHSETWETKPALVLATIDALRRADADHAPGLRHARLERERLAATAAARAKLRGPSRWQFDAALRSSQLFSQGRERSKTTIIRAIHGFRLICRELGRRARDRGGPPDVTDLFLVSIEELPAFVADPRPFAQTIEDRRAQMARLAGLVPPFVFEGRQPPPETWERRDAPVAGVTAGTILTGIGGCPGVARGRARVVLDPIDPHGLGPGEVLVAPITDPSWTPLFMAAEAVVVDVGAQQSHAVIVSRELGIPAVVSVTGATRTIPDGALIEVDGTRGVVTILEV